MSAGKVLFGSLCLIWSFLIWLTYYSLRLIYAILLKTFLSDASNRIPATHSLPNVRWPEVPLLIPSRIKQTLIFVLHIVHFAFYLAHRNTRLQFTYCPWNGDLFPTAIFLTLPRWNLKNPCYPTILDEFWFHLFLRIFLAFIFEKSRLSVYPVYLRTGFVFSKTAVLISLYHRELLSPLQLAQEILPKHYFISYFKKICRVITLPLLLQRLFKLHSLTCWR